MEFMALIGQSPYYNTLSPEEIVMLQGDDHKMERFCEVMLMADCIVPGHRAVVEIFAEYKHLMEDPGLGHLAMFGGSGMDLANLTQHNIYFLFYQHGAFVREWEPLLKRWQAGHHDVLQPYVPNPEWTMAVMMTKTSQQEQELAGATSITVRGSQNLLKSMNAMTEEKGIPNET